MIQELEKGDGLHSHIHLDACPFSPEKSFFNWYIEQLDSIIYSESVETKGH